MTRRSPNRLSNFLVVSAFLLIGLVSSSVFAQPGIGGGGLEITINNITASGTTATIMEVSQELLKVEKWSPEMRR